MSQAQELIDRPTESLSVEIKRWIDPGELEGVAKIVRALIALRNHNGGHLIIGFDDVSLQPDQDNAPQDVEAKFHIDKIQGLVTRFASEPFEVTVEFPQRDGQPFPVIVVPSGVKTPVAACSDLLHNGASLISANDVYVRSLRSNNTPSTTKAGWKDWQAVMQVCFDNREADIGRFVRRHLSGLTPDVLRELVSVIGRVSDPQATTEDTVQRILKVGRERYTLAAQEREVNLPDHGAWEVALLLVGEVPKHSANMAFLSLLSASNPGFTGWPVWLDSRGFYDLTARPYVANGVWEALLVSKESGWSSHLDFMLLDPKGQFYLRRALQDDINGGSRVPEALSALDFGLPVIRCAEAVGVGIAFAKAMGCDPAVTTLAFAFSWTKLKGRELTSWVKPERYISPGRRAYQDEVVTFVNVPLETPMSAVGEFVDQAVQPLFEVFSGFQLGKDVIEDLTRRLLERRL